MGLGCSDETLEEGIVYFNRANLYGVGGIPHLQWNGVDEIVGAGSQWWDRYDDYYPLVVDYSNQQTPYDIEITGAYISGDPSVPYEITVTQGGGSPVRIWHLRLSLQRTVFTHFGALQVYTITHAT